MPAAGVQAGDSTAQSAAQSAAQGMGNGAAQEALKKRVGGGTWTVQSGDTLSRIASKRYGNAALWQGIRDSNPDRVKDNGRLIYVGTVLNVPEIDVPDVDAAGAASASQGTTGAAVAPPVQAAPAVQADPPCEAPAQEPVSRVTPFGTFEIYPDEYLGPLPESHDGVQVVLQARFAELEAEAATATVDADVDALAEGVSFAVPVVVTIAGEQVLVASKAEAQHAAQMFKEIREVYGIQVDSQAGVDAIKAQYTQVPATELDKLKTKEWEYKEVLGLHRALAHFAPLLAQGAQGVGTVSKVDQAIDGNRTDGKINNATLGEYFAESQNLSVFTAGTNSTTDFSDNQTQLEATAIHELAHGLMRDEIVGYYKATGYWQDADTPMNDLSSAEAPITEYGRNRASEDLSEATMYYFLEPDTLRDTCPLRYAYIDRVVSAWSESSTSN
jgi:hypothetical protein